MNFHAALHLPDNWELINYQWLEYIHVASYGTLHGQSIINSRGGLPVQTQSLGSDNLQGFESLTASGEEDLHGTMGQFHKLK